MAVELDREIAGRLITWYEINKRSLPWRADREPYHIWLSEVMCQQTRVEAVKAYYQRFLQYLPSIQSLADCPEEQLNKLKELDAEFIQGFYFARPMPESEFINVVKAKNKR